MAEQVHLPTFMSAQWSVTAFKDSMASVLMSDQSCTTVKMYFYAVTNSGWDQVRKSILRWKRAL